MKLSQLFMIAAFGAAILLSCKKDSPKPSGPNDTRTVADPTAQLPYALSINGGVLAAPVMEAKFYKLFSGYNSSDDFEASGVKVSGNYFYAVFDNRYKIGKVKSTLPINSSSNSLLSSGSGSSNFEGITYDSYNTAHYYVIDENESHNGAYSPKIYQYDVNMNLQSTAWAPYSFSSSLSNKGFEGIAWVRRGSDDYLLGLCESSGIIVVMKQNGNDWDFISTFTMPASAGMTDFSDMDISSDLRVAVTSQESSKLWIGQLSSTSWNFTDDGTAYTFPTGSQSGTVGAGNYVLYGNIEGVSWINSSQVVCVSDKAKSDQPGYQSYKDQSIHIFNIP